MNKVLYLIWLDYFFKYAKNIFPRNIHLLILNFISNKKTIIKTKNWGLDMVTLLSHMSHVLQLLDVTYFKSFKVAFMKCTDSCDLANNHRAPKKEDLAEWVIKTLKTLMNVQILRNDSLWQQFGCWMVRLWNKNTCLTTYTLTKLIWVLELEVEAIVMEMMKCKNKIQIMMLQMMNTYS